MGLRQYSLYQHLAKSGHHHRCIKMLLRWVWLNIQKNAVKKKKIPLFVGPAGFASANKEVALFDSFTVSVCKQTLSSRPGFSCWSLLNIIIYYMCWCFDWCKIFFRKRYTSLENCYLFPCLFVEGERSIYFIPSTEQNILYLIWYFLKQ